MCKNTAKSGVKIGHLKDTIALKKFKCRRITLAMCEPAEVANAVKTCVGGCVSSVERRRE